MINSFDVPAGLALATAIAVFGGVIGYLVGWAMGWEAGADHITKSYEPVEYRANDE